MRIIKKQKTFQNVVEWLGSISFQKDIIGIITCWEQPRSEVFIVSWFEFMVVEIAKKKPDVIPLGLRFFHYGSRDDIISKFEVDTRLKVIHL